MYHIPSNKLWRIIKDADDVGHLGKPRFRKNAEQFKLEREYLNDNTLISDKDWLNSNIDFLQNHNWLSKVGIKAFNKTKKGNLTIIKE